MSLKQKTLTYLNQLNLTPRKSLGQNFLVDESLLKRMISMGEITIDDIILEIGPGLGTLTELLAERAKKIIAVEIDPVLSDFLHERFREKDNIELIREDILRAKLPTFDKVISNIPYSITGPLFEQVFFKKSPPSGVLTIEKNLADRIFTQGDYKTISRITISVNTFLEPFEKIKISKNCFYPVPKIELSLIKLVPKKNIDVFLQEDDQIHFFLNFIAGVMPFKNKDLLNALMMYLKNANMEFSKKEISKAIESAKLVSKKVFSLKIDEFVLIGKQMHDLIHAR